MYEKVGNAAASAGAVRHTADRYIDAVVSRVKQHVETAHLFARVA